MLKTVNFDIIGGYSKEEFNELDPQTTINLYQVNGTNGRKALFSTPGLSLADGINFVQEIEGVGRACKVFKNTGFVVIGSAVYKVITTLSGIDHTHINDKEPLLTTTGFVKIVNLNEQVAFFDGVGGWIYDLSSGAFTKITNVDFLTLKPIDAEVLGNRIVVLDGESKLSFYSAFGDGFSWNLNDRNSFTSYSDVNVACARLGGRLFIMGQISTEPWYENQSISIDPYARSELALDFGCAAAGSVATGFGILVWLTKTDQGVGSIVATTGGKPFPISNQALETEFEKYTDVSDASGYIYKNEIGHIIYVLNFTAANSSWMYDFNTKLPFKLNYEGGTRHLGQKHMYLGGKHYVVDYSAPKLYEMSNQFYDDAGVKIQRARISTILQAPPGTRINLHKLTLKLKQGTGGDCGIEEDPICFLAISKDDGESYGNDMQAKIGKIGQRTWTTSFDRLGNGKSFVFRISYDNAKPFVLLDAELTYEIVKGGD